MPFRCTFIVALTMLLTGCDSADKRAAIFMSRCIAANFAVEQCAFLFALAGQSKSDSDDAFNLALIGMSAGMSSTGRSR